MQPSKSLDISNTMEKKNNYIKLTLVDLILTVLFAFVL